MTLGEELRELVDSYQERHGRRYDISNAYLDELMEELSPKLLKQARKGLTSYECRIDSRIDQSDLMNWLKSEGIECFKIMDGYYNLSW